MAGDAIHRIQASIRRNVCCTELKLYSLSLLDGVAAQNAPTSERYALHYIDQGDDKWKYHVMAWDPNVAKSELLKKREVVAHFFTSRHATTLCESNLLMPNLAKVGSQGIAYVFDGAIEMFEALYSMMKPRLPSVRVPWFWRESAISAFALSCSISARYEDILSHRAKTANGPPTTISEPSYTNTPSSVSLSFDCVNRVFSMSGLKLGTMRALARVWGFNSAEIESLINRRCNPIKLLGNLVVDPEKLRETMHDCDVVLVGSRAIGFFWPSASHVDSEWRFITHPHVSHWLKFAAYLVSIGVQFELPVGTDDSRTLDDGDSSNLEQGRHSAVKVLRGTVWHRGRLQRLRLAAHLEYPRQQSSIQEVLRSHSSIAQCFVTGFGAVCMYGQQTTNGRSHIWSVGDCHDSGPRVRAHKQVDRIIDRGIEYNKSKSYAKLEPTRVPEPKLRRLGDAGTLIISFERVVSDKKSETVRTDFKLLGKVSWWEECHGLKAVRQDGGSFWSLSLEKSWVSRAVSRGTQSVRIPLFDSIMGRLRCTNCQIKVGTLCREHAFSDNDELSARLLFFCLRYVERHRMSWSLIGLDIHWDDCWEYPYV
jgi:hypothetical protein